MSSPTNTDQQPSISGGADWRTRVEQSYRNTQVREIASVLAGLEPGASTSSKLRLAMQFEDTVFKAANSLVDYSKRLSKRLKKVQKTYVPTQHAATSNKETAIQQLRQQYGDTLRYVLKHGPKAVVEMKAKHGEEKAGQLRQHIEGVKLWAADLGILEHTQINLNMSPEHLEKLTTHLESRTQNIRAHVCKLADPDQFMLETLEKTHTDFQDESSKYLALDTRKRYEQLQKETFHAEANLKEALEQTQATIPLPTRTQQNDERTALIHLDRMRAASSVFLSYMGIVDKITVPRNTLPKTHNVAIEGIAFVCYVLKRHRDEFKEPDVSLQDAWMKTLELPVPVEALDGASPETKRRKFSAAGPVLRSKVLLTTGRKTPSNLLPAFKRKRATLVRPPPRGQGSHLVLDFGTAFSMTIFFVPLLVELRAYCPPPTNESNAESTSEWKPASWTPLHAGLIANQEKLSVFGVSGGYDTLGRVVEEKLRDASAHATHVLRKCFADSSATVKEDAAVFEVEILEATALLTFLQLARVSYMPNWVDDDS
jgi:hypothetical protein